MDTDIDGARAETIEAYLSSRQQGEVADAEQATAWFNGLSAAGRCYWLERAGSAMPAKAWEEYQRARIKTCPSDSAKLLSLAGNTAKSLLKTYDPFGTELRNNAWCRGALMEAWIAGHVHALASVRDGVQS